MPVLMVAAAMLTLQARIPLPECRGRIDHLAFDVEHDRLYVAELGNGSVAVVDVSKRKFERRLQGLHEPQGIAYLPALGRLYVSEGGDGTVRAFDVRDLKPLQSIKLDDDADNLRLDPKASLLYVGHGAGGLAVLDATSLQMKADIPLKAHPESFQLSPIDARVFVNIPDNRELAVLDREARQQIASWNMGRWSANFPMAVDPDSQGVLTLFRSPPRIARYSTQDGSLLLGKDACGDADDVFVDVRRKRVYVVCGDGVVDVLDRASLERLERFPTSRGARTGFYSESLDQLFVAAPALGRQPAEIWVLRPDD